MSLTSTDPDPRVRLAALVHEAGRMTIADERYERLHDEINGLLSELEATCD